jgi:hypothetical protein
MPAIRATARERIVGVRLEKAGELSRGAAGVWGFEGVWAGVLFGMYAGLISHGRYAQMIANIKEKVYRDPSFSPLDWQLVISSVGGEVESLTSALLELVDKACMSVMCVTRPPMRPQKASSLTSQTSPRGTHTVHC